MVGVCAFLHEKLGDFLAAILRRDDKECVAEFVHLVEVEHHLLVCVHVGRTEIFDVGRLDELRVEPFRRDLIQRLLELLELRVPHPGCELFEFERW